MTNAVETRVWNNAILEEHCGPEFRIIVTEEFDVRISRGLGKVVIDLCCNDPEDDITTLTDQGDSWEGKTAIQIRDMAQEILDEKIAEEEWEPEMNFYTLDEMEDLEQWIRGY